MDSERAVGDYSLHVVRNFGIMTLVGLAVGTQAQVLARAGDNQNFRIGYAIAGVSVASLIQILALFVVILQENFNRGRYQRPSAPVATLPALGISALVFVWYALFLGLFFGLELNAK